MSRNKIMGLIKQDSYTERGDRDEMRVEDLEEKQDTVLAHKEYMKEHESENDEANILDKIGDTAIPRELFKKVKDCHNTAEG